MRIANTHMQLAAAGGGVAITGHVGPGLETRQSGWTIYRVNKDGAAVVTDKDAAWYCHKKKTFF